MRRQRIQVESICCPFVNLDDSRCAERFTLGRMDEAFGLCFGAHHACPIHDEICAERDRRLVPLRLARQPVPT